MHDRYPRWWHDGPASRSSYYGDDAFFRTGWVVGDPVYEFGMFCELVVPQPRHYESYSSAWVSFRVGGWKPVRHCCPVCGGLRQPGHGVSVEIHWYSDHGHIDFRSHRRPVFLNASCVCDSRPRGKVKWVHTSSGWDRHDWDRHDKDRHDWDGHDKDRHDWDGHDKDRYDEDRHDDRDRDRARDKDRYDKDRSDKDRNYADDRGSHDRHDSDGHRSDDDGRHDGDDRRHGSDDRRHGSDGRRNAVQDDARHGIERERGDRGSDHAKSDVRKGDPDSKVDHRKPERDVATRDQDRSKIDDADRGDDRARERSEARVDRGKGQDKKGRDLGPNGKSRKSRGRDR
jgi:hypothetical protein